MVRADQVDELPTVEIEEVASFSALDVGGIVLKAQRIDRTARQNRAGPLVMLTRSMRRFKVATV